MSLIYFVGISIAATLCGCGKSNSDNANSSGASSSGQTSGQSGAVSPATVGPQQPSDADAAKAAIAAGNWDAAILSARRAIWTQPDNQDMAELIQDAVYRRAVQQGSAAFDSGNLDSALDAACVAVLHQPASQQATELLKKSRNAIENSQSYFGKYLDVRRLGLPEGLIKAQASLDGNTVIATTNSNEDILDIKAGTIKQYSTGGEMGFYDPMTSAVILPNNQQLVRIDFQGKTLWNQTYVQFRQHLIGFSPDGKFFAYCTPDGIVFIDASTGQQTSIKNSFPTTPYFADDSLNGDRDCFTLSKDGKLGAFATRDGTWSIFEVANGAIVKTFKGNSTPGGSTFGAAFDGNGHFAYSNDIEISVVDTVTWKESSTIEASGDCEFGADGKVVIVTDENRNTTLYDASAGTKLLGPLNLSAHALTADGTTLFVANHPPKHEIDAFRVIDGKQLGTMEDLGVVRGMVAAPNGLPMFWYFPQPNQDLCITSRPAFSDNASIKSIAPHSMTLPGSNADLASAIAAIKRIYGIEVIVFYNENSLPQPDGLQGLPQMATDPADPNAHSHLIRYLKDRALMDGTPGFYISVVMGSSAQPYTSAWFYYQGNYSGLLKQDTITKLGSILDNLTPQGSTDFPGTKLQQFVARLTQGLAQ